jgi:2-methylcitrate dehydratase
VHFSDGTILPEELVEYPVGHKRRRSEGIPLLVEKFRTNLGRCFARPQQQKILDISLDQTRLERMGVSDYIDLYVV